ncbi:mineralocorticoid receptor [Scyliorhinus canicula]|uniref:mineralocorticoid receptor n=1 Tax=Scyliorhinus canicula TaxID=7830 RepID=UPI0018F48057|nr:mineralocorticoid receptor [Scyliorhinus canicula]XP_038647890.1 mineralocorticoid receptor [Scyliorhinus canicula]XP_038647891.1 mineralocorticoid receptor [Scyliorhinus canicula]
METKGYIDYPEVMNIGRQWSLNKTTSSVVRDEIGGCDSNAMAILNVSCIPPVAKNGDGERSQEFSPILQHQPPYQVQHQDQHLGFLASDPKCNLGAALELSKTVAESMGLYMNSAKEMGSEFNYSMQPEQMEGRSSNITEIGGQEVNLQEEKVNAIISHRGMRRCSSSSSPGRNSHGSCISSPVNFNNLGCSVSSPNNINSCVPSPAKINYLALSSPDTVSNMRSSISSPDNNLSTSATSPSDIHCAISSPTKINSLGMSSPNNLNSLGSSISSPANISNLHSSVSSPNNMSSPLSTPSNLASPLSVSANNNILSSPNNNGMASSVSSPAVNNLHFSNSSPAAETRMIINPHQNPRARIQKQVEIKVFKDEKIKSECLETGSINNVNPVQFMKTEVDSDFGGPCFQSRGSSDPSNAMFSTPLKCEMNETACLNAMYTTQVSENPFSEIAHQLFEAKTSYGDTFDLYGILGIPTSSSNSSYEQDAYLQPNPTTVIKQEPNDEGYCQATCSPPSTIVGVNSTGQSFHYRIGASGTISVPYPFMRDQRNQLLNLITPVCTVLGSWKSHPITPQSSISPGRSDGYPLQGYIPEKMTRSPIRLDRSCSSVTSAPSKVCLVCADEASGCHYGVLTCGSCKVFFKRAVEGQQNYLCAGRNDCIIDKIRRKNCPACRLRKCFKAGMNLGARKSKKLGKVKGLHEEQQPPHSPKEGITFTAPLPEPTASTALVPNFSLMPPHINPSLITILEAIEPDVVYASYDSSQADTTNHLLSSLNKLAEKQMVRIVKWAKGLPGFRTMALDDQMTLLRYSWMCLMTFGLSWRSYKHTSGTMLYFAPDLVFNEQRMQQSAMYELCQGMQSISIEFVRLQLTYEEFLCMKAILLLGTIPKDGLKSQASFDEMRTSYIKELRRVIARNENNSGQNWQRFYQLTKILDCMHELVSGLLQFCFYTFVESKALKIEFPDMLVEIINDQLPEVTAGMTKSLLFHKK